MGIYNGYNGFNVVALVVVDCISCLTIEMRWSYSKEQVTIDSNWLCLNLGYPKVQLFSGFPVK